MCFDSGGFIATYLCIPHLWMPPLALIWCLTAGGSPPGVGGPALGSALPAPEASGCILEGKSFLLSESAPSSHILSPSLNTVQAAAQPSVNFNPPEPPRHAGMWGT